VEKLPGVIPTAQGKKLPSSAKKIRSGIELNAGKGYQTLCVGRVSGARDGGEGRRATSGIFGRGGFDERHNGSRILLEAETKVRKGGSGGIKEAQ